MAPRIHTEICNTFYQKNGIASLYLFDRVKKIMQIICFSHIQISIRAILRCPCHYKIMCHNLPTRRVALFRIE